MITDSQSNFLYLSPWLFKDKHTSEFYKEFEKKLNECNIPFELLPETNDYWAVDFMPIQIEKDKFVQFVYNPDYIRNFKTRHQYRTDTNLVCKAINLKTEKYNLLVDGGNVIRSKNMVIMCDKVFKENENLDENKVRKQLEKAFEVDKIIIIPTDPEDSIGHADGMVRFYTDDTVLINEYSDDDTDLKELLISSLKKAGLRYETIPYNPYSNKGDDAKGVYINYLQMKKAIILPTFNMKEDDIAIQRFEYLFSDKTIKTIDSCEIAKGGGVLNCITWNILR